MSNSSSHLIPFWEKEKRDNLNGFFGNQTLKKVLFVVKCILYSFSGIMILWSFIQSFAAPYTNYHSSPGHGLEFGYLPSSPSSPSSNTGTRNTKFDVSSFSIAGPGYHAFWAPTTVYGPFLSWFVYPVARIFISIIYFFYSSSTFLSSTGLDVIFAMIIIMFFMRFISFWSILRSSIYAERQVLHQNNIDAISAKYERYDVEDKQWKIKKYQEINAYNKKHNLKPFAALENFFISTPIFLIVFRLVTITRPVKFTVLFGIWDLSKTPSYMIFNHLLSDGWKYLLLCLVIIPVNFLSQKTSGWFSNIRNPQLKKQSLNKNSQMYKMRKIQQIMTFVFLMFTFFWSTSLGVYYFFNSIFTIFQNFLIHKILLKRRQNLNLSKMKLQKLGLDV